MKYNCNRTLDYQHEYKRMCCAFKGCDDCPLGYDCSGEVSQKRIDIVQKWSDEHPEETMLEHFKKLFPNALCTRYEIPRTCPKLLGWIDDVESCRGIECCECWSKPYEQDK